MARRRGFIAEYQRQIRLAEQRERRAQTAAVRAHNQSVREAEAAQRKADAEQKRAARAVATRQREAERVAVAAHKAGMEAQAQALTNEYLAIYDEIDHILEATLDVDDYVDLPSLKAVVEHPTFDRARVAPEVPRPNLITPPPEPVFTPPPEPSGLRRAFGGVAKYEQEYHAAGQRWQDEHNRWQWLVSVEIPAQNARLLADYETAEREREATISRAYSQYERECTQRQLDVDLTNRDLDSLIAGLSNGDAEAVDEYIGIVLANSIYPDSFPVTHSFTFDSDLRELSLTAMVPPPSTVPTVKHVKYVAKSDELRETPLAQKDQRIRYNDAIAAVALRTLHEVFEADRAGHISSISLEVGTKAIDPATGHNKAVVFVLAAAAREQFLALNLSSVDKQAALGGINAALSKNPFALTPVANGSRSVRR